jgi:ATP-dependent exoDNAse (exonuclease V) beta subunit
LLLQGQTVGLAALQEFLADCALMTLGVDANSDVQTEAVRLATLHGSKGLEFNTVFIVGARSLLVSRPTPDLRRFQSRRRCFKSAAYPESTVNAHPRLLQTLVQSH